ncbi:hypothetical protein OF001_U170004 [Pseudomonas sp. OF001]|nr:hypothetical protein OF001_U170004 [Pseudomonas sp. OF001]
MLLLQDRPQRRYPAQPGRRVRYRPGADQDPARPEHFRHRRGRHVAVGSREQGQLIGCARLPSHLTGREAHAVPEVPLRANAGGDAVKPRKVCALRSCIRRAGRLAWCQGFC